MKIVQNNSSIFYLCQRAQTDLEAMLKMKKGLHQSICQSKFRQEEERATVWWCFSLLIVTTDFFFIKVVYFWRIVLLQK